MLDFFQPYCYLKLMSKVIQLITLGWFKRLLQFDGRRTTILTYLNWLYSQIWFISSMDGVLIGN